MLKHGLTTIGAVWLAMAVAGMVPMLVPSRPGEVASLLVYIALLAAYARWTEAGRRSAGAYFIGAFFSPMMCFYLLVPLLPRLPTSFFENGGAIVFVGLGVGFQSHGGADTPIEAYLPLMLLNILLPIVAVVGARGFVRYRRQD
jgi:hypothetical protein